jgi:Arm DNA-binding domain
MSRSAAPKSWVFRYAYNGVKHDMGLGSLELVTLAEARDKALLCRKLLLDGIDPLEERRSKRTQALLSTAGKVTFRTCAERYIKAHAAGWRNGKHRVQWENTLSTYAYPVIGDVPVASVDHGMVLRIIEPLWAAKTETASRLRGRLESILDWATARRYRTGENPARWRGHLDKLLPPKSRSRRPTTTRLCRIRIYRRSWPSCAIRPVLQPDAWSSRS